MVVLDEKALMLPPPPPYVEAGPVSPPPFPTQHRPPLTLVTLPPHILLRIVYETFSQGQVERQRKVLYWLTMSLRLVNRAMYTGEHIDSKLGNSTSSFRLGTLLCRAPPSTCVLG